MAGAGPSLRGYEKNEDESEKSFVLSCDYESDDFLADDSETRNSAAHRVMEDPTDGRLTPDIDKAIRRSLHRFSRESFDADKDRNSGDDLIPDSENEPDDDVQIVQNKRRLKRPVNLESSDEGPAAAKNLKSSYGGPVVPKNRVEAEVALKNWAEKEDSPEKSGEEEHSAKNSVEEELAMSIAMKETRNSSLDPLKAQKKACLVHQKQHLEKKLTTNKMRVVMEKIEEIVKDKDKVIVMSQWLSVLEIVGAQLDAVKEATYRSFTGKVPVKNRQEVMDDFNSPHSRTNVLILSLRAGGVGLNLVGANHLLLIDIHWNPQLECQVQDHIYRFGQKKNVFIYKYICVDTIEERIKDLQDRKMEIADNLRICDPSCRLSCKEPKQPPCLNLKRNQFAYQIFLPI